MVVSVQVLDLDAPTVTLPKAYVDPPVTAAGGSAVPVNAKLVLLRWPVPHTLDRLG